MTKAEYKDLKEVPDPYFGGPEGFEKVSRHVSAIRACDAVCQTGGLAGAFILAVSNQVLHPFHCVIHALH